MLFNSAFFCFLFLPIVITIYFMLNKRHNVFGLVWLIFASLVFYGYWNNAYLWLITGSVLFNYSCGHLIISSIQRDMRSRAKLALVCGVIGDLLLLGYYKYTDFFLSNLSYMGMGNYQLLKITLPLGISFFTFTQIAYLVDAYRRIVPKQDIVSYGLFVTYFPHLLAGPILHYRDMMPQFLDRTKKNVDWEQVAFGIALFIIGLFKKVVLADKFATWADPGFNSEYLSMAEAWVTALSYTFQIYFDFSGYTDMAIGMSAIMNISLPINFNSPYKANSIIDFWKRWHITLSTLLRDYLYIPLGGNRKGSIRRYANLLITMILGGLWHGASWTFVFWGLLHGSALAVNHMFRTLQVKIHWTVGRIMTFLVVVIGWVFFRAETFHSAGVILHGMVNWQDHGFLVKHSTMPQGKGEYLILLVVLMIVFKLPNSLEIAKNLKPNWRWALATSVAGLVATGIMISGQATTFIYYQF